MELSWRRYLTRWYGVGSVLRILAQHLLQNLHGQALGSEGLDGLAVLDILYSEFCPSDVVGLLRGGKGRGLMPGEGSTIDHGLRPQGSQVPFRPSLEAGLGLKQNFMPTQTMSSGRAGQHTLSQHEEFLAQQSLAPLGTCWRVGT